MLRKLVTKYEIIIFAEEDCNFVMNSLNHVDPRHQYIQGFLGRESMVWRGGHYIKDLKYLNRDLRKIVVVDHKL
jgi:import inner membrane translocase subunit TIM50